VWQRPAQEHRGAAQPKGYLVSVTSYVPTGQDASVVGNNLKRWYSSEVTNLLHQFKQTTVVATQKAIITKIEKIQLDQVPYIPLNYGANWDVYSTLHFTGFSTPDNYPDNEVVMLNLNQTCTISVSMRSATLASA
jgi:ABC-type transport system substrate-binding protein